MKRIVVSLVSIVLVMSMLLCMVSCGGQKKEIKNLVSEFENACNTLDFESVLDCINPKVAEGIKFGAGIVGMFTNMTTEDMFGKLADVLSNEDLGGAEFFESIKIDVKDIEIDSETASVSALIKYNVSDKDVEKEAMLKCTYDSEKWYISGLSFN